MHNVKLTQYSHGAGCGCKISPKDLDSILKTTREKIIFPSLLVGNESKDDAACYDLGDGTSVISTTDFFMPIVDDAFTFGRIAATNAISDIYAMGGKPLMAIAIFGWPMDKLSVEVAQEVIDGGRFVCEEAGIPLAGGHSIDSPEPIFGLAVTGLVENKHLKQNNTAQIDCQLFLTKPLGIGILTTAQKQGKISNEDINTAIDAMCTLNKIGADISKLNGVTALTDITGFGLLGHLSEICEASEISAQIRFADIPLLTNVDKYLQLGCTPGGTQRNFESYGDKISEISAYQKNILCDPQTSGGLLCVVKKENVSEFLSLCKKANLNLSSIGETIKSSQHLVEVI